MWQSDAPAMLLFATREGSDSVTDPCWGLQQQRLGSREVGASDDSRGGGREEEMWQGPLRSAILVMWAAMLTYYGCCKRDHAVEEEDGSKAEAGVPRAKDSSDVADVGTAGKDSDSRVVQLRQWARDGNAK
ncbi:hypothetical protein BHM03_00008656 [Ensete ventricosum]|nr:hypothetical protein BHM03_00008656 [Ensete ventricosum]